MNSKDICVLFGISKMQSTPEPSYIKFTGLGKRLRGTSFSYWLNYLNESCVTSASLLAQGRNKKIEKMSLCVFRASMVVPSLELGWHCWKPYSL